MHVGSCFLVIYYTVGPLQHILETSLERLQNLCFLVSPWYTSKIPGELGFPFQACCAVSVTYLLRAASIAWCLEEIVPLSSQWCSPTHMTTQGELFFSTNHLWSGSHSFISCQYLIFSWSREDFCVPESKNLEVNLACSLERSARASR